MEVRSLVIKFLKDLVSLSRRKAIRRKFATNMLKQLEFYDSAWNSAHARVFYELQRTDESWQELFKTLRCLCQRSETVLDVGCGPYELMSVRNDSTAVGVDLSKAALAMLRKGGFLGHVVQASSLELPFKQNSFDSVICNQMIEHLTTVEFVKQAIGEMRECQAT